MNASSGPAEVSQASANIENEAPDTRLEATAKDRLWMENYRKLEAFKRENGHCRVPQSFKDKAQALWVESSDRFNQQARCTKTTNAC